MSKLEAILAKNVQSYLADYKSGDRIEAERLRELCSTLARFLGELVRGHENWSRFYWVDDIAPLSVKVDSSSKIVVDGLLIWGQEKQSYEWREPLLASLKIAIGTSSLEYRILCGDSAKGLGTARCGEEGLWAKVVPRNWLFTFTNAAN